MNLPVPQQHGNSKLPSEWKNTTDSKTWVHKRWSYLVFSMCNTALIELWSVSHKSQWNMTGPTGSDPLDALWNEPGEIGEGIYLTISPMVSIHLSLLFGKLEKHNRLKDSGAQQAWHQVLYHPSRSIYIACNGILDMSRYGLALLELGQLAPQIMQLPMSKAKTIFN